MAERWRGIFTILLTPFHEDRLLDQEVLRRRGVVRTTVCREPDPDLDEHDLAELDYAMRLARPDLVAEVVA